MILVTGGTGFVGRYVCDALEARGKKVRQIGSTYDLADESWGYKGARTAVAGCETVIHLAANVGGIEQSSTRHGEMLRDNVAMALHMLEEAKREQVKTFVMVSSACVYPDSDYPMSEALGMVGKPSEACWGYGTAKRIAEQLADAYSRWMRVVIVRPFNAYGPGDMSHHVIPDLIRKVMDHHVVEIWGGGEQRRDFTYVTDWASGLLHIMDQAEDPKPINLSSGQCFSIREVAEKLARLCNVNAEFLESHGPVGHGLRTADTSWLYEHGWAPQVDIDQGLARTVEWWRGK